jgi:syntaxin 1B/2/3
LDANITRIDQLHNEVLSTPDFATSVHTELDSLVPTTSSLITSIKANLEGLGNDARNGGIDAKKKVDLVNAQRKRLQDRVSKFQNVEKTYRDRLRDRAIRQYQIGKSESMRLSIVNPDMSEEELTSALSDPNTQIFQQALMTSTRSSQAQSTLREVQSRHNDILSIERKIHDLAQLFSELSVMVEFQEVHIDKIDDTAGQTKGTMQQGLEQVSRATRLAAAARRKKWWCFFIFLIIIIVVVVVVGMSCLNLR